MGKKILIVDDAMFMRKVIRRYLEHEGYTDILEAEDGEQGYKLYVNHKPDLVLLDITMPGKSVIEVLEDILKEDPQGKIIMCSAVGQDMMIQKALINGAADFIVKPFKEEEFIRVVNASLQN